MVRAWLLAAVVLLASGCASAPVEVSPTSSTAPPAATLPPLTTGPIFAPMVVAARLAFPMSEPMAVTDALGRVYADAPTNDVIVRSDDNGTSFHAVSPVPAPQDGALATGPDGSVYASGLTNAPSGALEITFMRSADGGEHWSEPVVLAHGNVDRQWFASAAPGQIVGAWRDRNDSKDQFTAVRVSDDNGQTWSAPTRLVPDQQTFAGPVLAGRDGAYYIPWDPYTDCSVHVSRSTDGGRTWVASQAVAGSCGIPVLAQDSGGTLYLASWTFSGQYVGTPTGQTVVTAQLGVALAVSHDRGTTWSKPLLLSPPDRNAFLPWIVAGAPGRVAVAWYEDTLGGSRSKPDNWYLVMSVSSDADTASPHFYAGRSTQTPTHVGQMCSECGVYTTCLPEVYCPLFYGPGSPRSRLDLLGLTIAADGSPVVVYDADRPTDPTQIDLVASRPTNVRLI